jgi:hypothetical protein
MVKSVVLYLNTALRKRIDDVGGGGKNPRFLVRDGLLSSSTIRFAYENSSLSPFSAWRSKIVIDMMENRNIAPQSLMAGLRSLI